MDLEGSDNIICKKCIGHAFANIDIAVAINNCYYY